MSNIEHEDAQEAGLFHSIASAFGISALVFLVIAMLAVGFAAVATLAFSSSPAHAQTVVCNVSGSNNPCAIEATIVGSIAIDNSTTINSKRVVIVIANKPKHGWSVHGSNPKHAPCWCSDDPNNPPGLNHGYMTPYSTPLGYSPMGPVSVYCPDQSDRQADDLNVRSW